MKIDSFCTTKGNFFSPYNIYNEIYLDICFMFCDSQTNPTLVFLGSVLNNPRGGRGDFGRGGRFGGRGGRFGGRGGFNSGTDASFWIRSILVGFDFFFFFFFE